MLAAILTHLILAVAGWLLHKFAGRILLRWLERRAGSLAWRLLRHLI